MYTLLKQKGTKSNSYELITMQLVRSLLGCESLSILQDNFKTELEKLPRKGISSPSNHYKMIFNKSNDGLELWHIDSIGNYDRMVLIITNKK
jgi:hypothetical protein